MALVKATLKASIYAGFYDIFKNQVSNASGNEQEDPDNIIKNIADKMATVVSDAVEVYVMSGDVPVGPANILVTSTSPGSPAVVATAAPAKMI